MKPQVQNPVPPKFIVEVPCWMPEVYNLSCILPSQLPSSMDVTAISLVKYKIVGLLSHVTHMCTCFEHSIYTQPGETAPGSHTARKNHRLRSPVSSSLQATHRPVWNPGQNSSQHGARSLLLPPPALWFLLFLSRFIDFSHGCYTYFAK